jgi:subtilisin family serine protease
MSFGSFVLLVSAALLGLSIANDTFGPWIVHFDEAIENSVFEATVQTVYNALPLLTKPSDFEITHSFKLALHAIVVKGLTEEQLLAIPGVELVNPDVMFKVEEYNWGTDRIDQESLPLDNSYNPDFDGQGVDAYIIDTGVDCGHIEFEGRVCENIYNAYGANTPNTDGQGHGTHCAGT